MNPFYFLLLLVSFFVQLVAPMPQEVPQVNPFPLAASPLLETTPPRPAGNPRHLLSVNTTNFPKIKKVIPTQVLFARQEGSSVSLPVATYFEDPNGAALALQLMQCNGSDLPLFLKFNKDTHQLRLAHGYSWNEYLDSHLKAIANNTYGAAYECFETRIDDRYIDQEYTFMDRIIYKDQVGGLWVGIAGFVLSWITVCSIVSACIHYKKKALAKIEVELT